jgi:7-carboxy-7-deazaguanine synthase
MRVAEIYKSMQGEGLLTGTESIFVRASGCNLRCGYCDTPFASWNPEGEDLSVEEISAQVLDFDCGHVVLTGGEPMLFAELIPLAMALRAADRHITIETAGTLYLPVDCDLMSISPKLSNSAPDPSLHAKWFARHERTRHVPLVIHRLTSEYEYQMKFVVDSLADAEEVEHYLRELPQLDRTKIMLMPQGTDAQQLAEQFDWLEPYCAAHGLQYCPRKHIEWFGFARGT